MELGVFMILVEYINVIFEDSNCIIYFQTSEGFFHHKVTSAFAEKLSESFKDKISLYNDLISNASIDIQDKEQNFCILSKSNGNIKATLQTIEPNSFNTWEEALLIALKKNILVFLEEDLLMSDYVVEAEHELLVAELVDQVEKFHKSSHIKNVIQNMALAVGEERNEDAKELKEKLELEARKHNVNGSINEQKSTEIDSTESTNIKN